MKHEGCPNLEIVCWKSKMMIWGSLNLLFSLFCVILVCVPVRLGNYEVWTRLFGAAVAVFFLWKAFFQLHSAKEREYLLKMDENGLEDHSSPYAGECLIPWENIAAVRIKSVFFERYIAVELLSDTWVLNRMPWMKRMLIRIRGKLGYTALSIPINGIGGQVNQVLETAQFYMKQR